LWSFGIFFPFWYVVPRQIWQPWLQCCYCDKIWVKEMYPTHTKLRSWDLDAKHCYVSMSIFKWPNFKMPFALSWKLHAGVRCFPQRLDEQS
jgi:hypothetical protein